MIRTVFNHVDLDKDGVISITDIGSCINPKGHPTVRAGEMKPMELLSELIISLEDSGCAMGGQITADSLIEYYRLASAFMDDEFFNSMMANMWNLPEAQGAGGSSNRSRNDRRPKTLGSATSIETGSDAILSKLKAELAKRGARGIVGLGRKFRIMDDDGSKSLDMAEFTKAMKECALNLTKEEVNALFQYFDKDRNGTVGYEEFLQGVRGQLNARRKDLVMQAFDVMDKDGSGEIEPNDVVGVFNADKHPDVLAGKKTAREVLEEFLETFDVGGEKDGKVTKNEWMNYYSNVSSSIDDDDYFELMIRNAWHISGGEGWCANSSNKRVLVTHSDGTQSVQEISNDLGVKADDKDEMTRRLKAQGVDVSGISTDGAVEDEEDGTAPQNSWQRAHANRTAAPVARPAAKPKAAPKSLGSLQTATQVKHDDIDEAAKAIAARGARQPTAAPTFQQTANPNAASSTVDHGTASILVKLKKELSSRGAKGIVGMGRKFRIMDDDGSKSLNMAEFKKAMKEMNMGLSDKELRVLFTHFDADNGGSINFEEFIQGVRDPLSDRRRALVDMAFAKLDKDGSGNIDAEEIASVYDASKHPEVIEGRKTPEQVSKRAGRTLSPSLLSLLSLSLARAARQHSHTTSFSRKSSVQQPTLTLHPPPSTTSQVFTEFMETFEVGGEHDGKVTLKEFQDYYTNVGANIPDDDYFELMIRNAWHISGGEGWCANTANRRVLVTHADGRQTVEEIKEDLGVKADDKDEMVKRLKRQGVNAANISTFDGAGDEDAKPGKKPKAAAPKAASLATQVRKPKAATSPTGSSGGAMSDADIATLGGKSNAGKVKLTPVGKKKKPVAAPSTPSTPAPDAGNAMLIKKIKAALASRGARGFIGLQRKFRIMDDDDSKSLNLGEFKKGLIESGLELPDKDMRRLFECFDAVSGRVGG